MAKRIALALYDATAALLCALVASCAFATPAFAYIDPSVMTYTIQAVAGVAVALSAVAGVALRRGRKVFMRILDIDEDSKKEFEPDVHRIGETAVAEESAVVQTPPAEEEQPAKHRKAA